MATRGLPSWPWTAAAAQDLPDPESLVLDAVRAWAAPGSPGPLAQAGLVLAAAGAEGAALWVDALLRRLPGLSPACPLCPVLCQEEGDLLLALGAAQAGRRSVALALLHRLAPPLAAYRAMPELLGLACALRRAEVTLAGPV